MSDYDFEIEDEEEVEPLHAYAPAPDEYAFDLGEEEDDSSAGVDVPPPPPPRYVRPNATHVLQRETMRAPASAGFSRSSGGGGGGDDDDEEVDLSDEGSGLFNEDDISGSYPPPTQAQHVGHFGGPHTLAPARGELSGVAAGGATKSGASSRLSMGASAGAATVPSLAMPTTQQLQHAYGTTTDSASTRGRFAAPLPAGFRVDMGLVRRGGDEEEEEEGYAAPPFVGSRSGGHSSATAALPVHRVGGSMPPSPRAATMVMVDSVAEGSEDEEDSYGGADDAFEGSLGSEEEHRVPLMRLRPMDDGDACDTSARGATSPVPESLEGSGSGGEVEEEDEVLPLGFNNANNNPLLTAAATAGAPPFSLGGSPTVTSGRGGGSNLLRRVVSGSNTGGGGAAKRWRGGAPSPPLPSAAAASHARPTQQLALLSPASHASYSMDAFEAIEGEEGGEGQETATATATTAASAAVASTSASSAPSHAAPPWAQQGGHAWGPYAAWGPPPPWWGGGAMPPPPPHAAGAAGAAWPFPPHPYYPPPPPPPQQHARSSSSIGAGLAQLALTGAVASPLLHVGTRSLAAVLAGSGASATSTSSSSGSALSAGHDTPHAVLLAALASMSSPPHVPSSSTPHTEKSAAALNVPLFATAAEVLRCAGPSKGEASPSSTATPPIAPPPAPPLTGPAATFLRVLAERLAQGTAPSGGAGAGAGAASSGSNGATMSSTSTFSSSSPSAAAAFAGMHPAVVSALANAQATLAVQDTLFARQLEAIRERTGRSRAALIAASSAVPAQGGGARPPPGGSPLSGRAQTQCPMTKAGSADETRAFLSAHSLGVHGRSHGQLTFKDALARVQLESR